MKIGIDARFLTHPQKGGFKTYTVNLIHALAALDEANEYVLYADGPMDDADALNHKGNVSVRIVRSEVPAFGMVMREQLALPSAVAGDKLDLFHAPCLTAPLRLPCPLVVTIHDMIWRTPQRFSAAGKLPVKRRLMQSYYQWAPEKAALKAAVVITVSHAARQDILRELHLPAERVVVTHEAANAQYQRVTDETHLNSALQRHGLARGFLLALGSADPRKNMGTLLKAYARLTPAMQAAHPLAIIWAHSHLSDAIAEQARALGILEHVRFLQRVPDADMPAMYSGASAFVFPSRYEGFGLPLLEAMACGAPVIASDNSSIPEVVGDVGLMVNAEDDAGMADSIQRVLADAGLRSTLVQKGLARAGTFTWRRCAAETLAAYALAAKGKSSLAPAAQDVPVASGVS
jgi:glycosyltransferase involved in cell wall biosynthesis